MSAQIQNDELKAAKLKLEEMQRIDDTHVKQLKLLERTREELEHQLETMTSEKNLTKTGKNLCYGACV